MDFSKFQIRFTSELPSILFENKISLLISTYQAGKVIALGSKDGSNIHQIPFSFKKPMGIALQDGKLAVACLDEVHFLSNKGNVQNTGEFKNKDYDTIFVHRSSYNTSRLDIHDIEFGKGALWGVNTAFSCLCKLDVNYSFVPKWKPNFISDLRPDDRCHLNGMALEDDLPKYVTALSKTNVKEGWRENIINSGVIMEVPSGDILLDGLAMPHSPRIINGYLYFLESGTGHLMRYDPATGKKEEIFAFGCFIRGLSFKGDLLFIGVSKIRATSETFKVLPVREQSTNAGLLVFDIKKNKLVASLDYLTTVEEIFDVQVLDGFLKPGSVNHYDDRVKEIITTPFGTFWKKSKESDD